MSYRHSQGCLGASSNIHFVRRTFSAESKTFSRDILPPVSYPEINVMIFSPEFEGTYRGPSNGHYSVIVGENKFCCHFIVFFVVVVVFLNQTMRKYLLERHRTQLYKLKPPEVIILSQVYS